MYNPEHYRDPTAGLALRNIAYQEQRENRRYHLAYTAPGYVVMVPIRKGKAIFMVRRQRPRKIPG